MADNTRTSLAQAYLVNFQAMDLASALLHSPNSFLFYDFLPFAICMYFLLAGSAYLYFYRFRKDRFQTKKIQKAQPTQSEIRHEIVWSLSSCFVWLFIAALVTVATTYGWMHLYFDIGQFGIPYFVFTVIVLIFAHDAYFYWTHWFMHSTAKRFYFFHKIHHTSKNPTPFAIFAFGPFEALLLGAYVPIMLTLIPVHFYALLTWFLFETVVNIAGHLGYELFRPHVTHTWWGRYLNTGIHHNMHHQDTRYNFGHYFNFWDKKMKTNNPNYHGQIAQFYRQ